MKVAIIETLDFYYVLKAREIDINIRILREMDESDIAGFKIDINTHFRKLLEVASKSIID
jgi:hypothetical protein